MLIKDRSSLFNPGIHYNNANLPEMRIYRGNIFKIYLMQKANIGGNAQLYYSGKFTKSLNKK